MKVCSDRVMAVSMCVALCCLPSAPGWGATIFVDDDTCPSTGAGTEGDPYCKIQDGINASANGDIVLVSPGTYAQPIRFFSKQIELRSTEGPASTTITRTSGNINVVRIEDEQGRETVLEGFTITGAAGAGYGVEVTGTDPTIRNCIITENITVGNGGGIGLFSSHALIEDTVISDNEGDTGGGIFIKDGRLEGGKIEIVRCTIEGNKALGTGGGEGSGGGILFSGQDEPTLHIYNSVIRDNIAHWHGGGIGVSVPATRGACTPAIDRHLVIANTLIACNTAGDDPARGGDGGGIFHGEFVDGEIRNCTFTGNSTDQGGGAFYAFCSDPEIYNSILWGNSAATGEDEIDIFEDTATVTVTYSDVEGSYTGTGNINSDPKFVDPLGPDSTACTADDDYRLDCCSPAIDAGNDPDVAPDTPDLDSDGNTSEPTPFDLDDLPRFVGTVDMGAYEFEGIMMIAWESVATHGTVGNLGIVITEDGTYVEGRRAGAGRIEVDFICALDPDTAIPGNLAISGCDTTGDPIDLSGTTKTVTLINGDSTLLIEFDPKLPGSEPVDNPAKYTITLSNLQGACEEAVTGNMSREMRVIVGDVWSLPNGSGDVTSTDLNITRAFAQAGVDPIDPANIGHVRADVSTDGKITSADVGLVRAMAAAGKDGTSIDCD